MTATQEIDMHELEIRFEDAVRAEEQAQQARLQAEADLLVAKGATDPHSLYRIALARGTREEQRAAWLRSMAAFKLAGYGVEEGHRQDEAEIAAEAERIRAAEPTPAETVQ